MAATNFTPIQLYFSTTASAVPLAANLAQGELAINITDGKLYYEDNGGVVQLLASSSGASGNVVGPASSTDNAISRFDGTTGKLIQNSVVTIADTTGDMAGVGTISSGAITSSSLTSTRVLFAGTSGLIQDSANLTFNGTDLTVSGAVNAGSINATTLDLTNLEVTNIKAKDGTASIVLADTTGIATFSNATVISTTDNTNAALRITQLGTGNALLVEDEANPDSTPFVIDASGTVITGATAALTNGAIQTLRFDGVPANDIIRKNTAGSGTVISGDTVGNLRFYGFDGTNYTRTAHIFSAVDGTPGANDMPGRLVFGTTADGASSPTERMRIDNAGRVGIAATPATGVSFTVGNTADTTATVYSIRDLTTVNQATTTTAIGVASQTNILTPAALTAVYRYFAAQGSFTGTVTTQYGYLSETSLTGATNNYGFYSAIASGTNRYNFYANGTADNYFAGSVGLGAVPAAGFPVNITYNLTGNVNSVNIRATPTVLSDVTATVSVFKTNPFTQAAAFTLGGLTHYDATQGTIGATSTVTNQFGYQAASSLTGATNNYGFYSNIASTANRWNFYAAGTARNYMAADLTVNGATAIPAGGTAGAGLMVSTTANFGVFFGSGAPTLSAAKGSLYLRSDGSTVNDRMYVNTNGSTTWTNVVTSA